MSQSVDTGLSAAQAAAVADERAQVLVAAAAGSGKTRLLVAAVVRALIEDELPVDRLVAVTFTRKAGAELALRVREALQARGRMDLAHSLDAAAVGTIDSLCRRLVKDQAIAGGVDPSCTVLEAEAATLLKMEIARQVWETIVMQADSDSLGLLASGGSRLLFDVVGLYDRLRGSGQSQPRIEIVSGHDEAQTRVNLERSLRGAMAAGEQQSKRSASLSADLAKLEGCLEWLEGPEELRVGETGLRTSMDLFPSRKSRALEGEFAAVRSALAEYRCSVAESLLVPLAEVVNALLAEFHRSYAATKSERGLVDFADLGLKASELLADGRELDEGNADGPFAGAFLLVDEFQDTNELQYSILARLGAERMLMVGDERQSIYGFRGADVDVFIRRREALEQKEETSPHGSLHRLDVNYRSSPEVLQFINSLFSHPDFFGEEFARLVPDPGRARIYPSDGAGPAGREGEHGARKSPSVEVMVAERSPADDDGGKPVSIRQAEAEVVASHVRAMLDQEGWRQRDVVLLLPTQIEVEVYQEALLRQGVDVYVVRGKGYYAQEEVTDITAMLRVLVSPHDDLALLSVLRSPMVSLSDDALYLLGRERGSRHAKSLWEVARSGKLDPLGKDDREALEVFVQRVRELRVRVGRPGLSRLIDDSVSSFGYDLCLLSAPEGIRRFANLRKLMRHAGEFESVSGPDLAGFLSVLRSMGQLNDREGSAPTLGEGEEVVRVMTVHQAKGLEFPVVMLAGLGADVHRPSTSTFAIGSDGRMGMFLKGYRNRTYEDYDPHWGPAAEIASDELRRDREEDTRLLYVAMTRAQERLVLVGARPTKGTLEGSRIGRIVAGLGLAGFPGSGVKETLLGSAAVVTGMTPTVSVGSLSTVRGEGAVTEGDEKASAESGGASPGAGATAGSPSFPEPSEWAIVPERVSFSALASYQRCPRQFYLERILGLGHAEGGSMQSGAEEHAAGQDDEFLDSDETNAGRDVGVLAHGLLERLAVTSDRPEEGSVRRSASEMLSEMGLRLSATDLDRAVELVLAVWDSPTADRLISPDAEREVPFFFDAEGVVVTGVMDLVCRETNRWIVTDYKTNALRGRSVAEVAQPYELQCLVYGVAALRAGASTVQMDLVFLERPGEPVTVRYLREEMAQLEHRLARVLEGLRKGVFPRSVGDQCGFCRVAEVCRAMVAD